METGDNGRIHCGSEGADLTAVGYMNSIPDCTGRLSDYDGTADIEFFADAAQPRKARADRGNFLILFPGEAHRPCISPDGKQTRVRKIVVKVPFVE